MKVIILAAGEGKRLRPLTNDKPKCMVKLFGKTLLQHQIDIFQSHNIDDISVVTGYKNEMINFKNIKYFKNNNYNSTNMLETLFCAEDELKSDVIVSYGDIIFEESVVQSLINSTDDISVVIDSNWKSYWEQRFINPLDDAESLTLDNDGFITNIGQKVTDSDQICGQFMGLMKFRSDSIDVIKDFYKKSKKQSKSGTNILNSKLSFENSYMTDFLQGLVNYGCRLKAVKTNNKWLELDTMNDYELYNKMDTENTLSKFFCINK
ncbi:phosphocholine cytidylyltransferase family protein [Nitrosopumilus sp.]|jgi:L-glutamine-phosphate cytidylyltransferase|nr:phosphocholine cytidylyltransferase family protein [Nitrosopumilus sp.]